MTSDCQGQGLNLDSLNTDGIEWKTQNKLTQLQPSNFPQKSQKHTLEEKKKSFSNKWCWGNWIASCRRVKIDPYPSLCPKISSKCTKGLFLFFFFFSFLRLGLEFRASHLKSRHSIA
jgi:hypothetical protein